MTWLISTSAAAWRSYRSLDPWVQAWMPWLVGINVAGVAQDHPTGRTATRALLAWLPVNAGLVVAERGMGRSLSFAHLWGYPPVVRQAARRLVADDTEPPEKVYAALVGATNAVSLAFDVVEVARWIGGARSVAGAETE